MPTLRGWAGLGAAAALTLLWVAFGEQMLLGAAVFLAIAVLFGVWYVRRIAPRVTISREMSPHQVHDGDRALVTVSLVAHRPLSHTHVTDTVEGLGAAAFVADHVAPRDPLIGRYEILCRPRGVYKVGPTDVRIRDPFGMAEAGGHVGRVDRLVVYPAIEPLDGIPVVRGHDPTLATSRARFSQTGGEDFFTMRPYQQGDDLRKVHWPTSAKRDELMIRQLEMPWQSRALVVLDPEAANYAGPETFEHAVRGAASAVHHLFGAGFSPTLWTGQSDGTTVASVETYGLAMEELAMVQPADVVDLRVAIQRMRRLGMAGGALVVVTGDVGPTHLGLYRTLGRDYTRTVVMAVTDEQNDAIMRFRQAGVVTVLSPRGTRWATAWQEALERSWSTATQA
jgi:uncharacterized protein (DUF58 family)